MWHFLNDKRITLFCRILSIKLWSISLHKCHISLLFCGRLDLVQKWQGHWSWSRSQIRNLVNQNHLIFHVTGPTSADFGSFPESGKARWESWIHILIIQWSVVRFLKGISKFWHLHNKTKLVWSTHLTHFFFHSSIWTGR